MPDPSLRKPLVRTHRAHQRRLVTRAVLGATAGALALIAVALAAGLVMQPGIALAWTRLILLLTGIAVVLAGRIRHLLRDHLTLDGWLEAVEQHFPAVRSWLRNALELESAPGEHTSNELARAVVAEARGRLGTVPLASLAPSLHARGPAFLSAGAMVVVTVLALALPESTRHSWNTLWSPESAAPPVRLVVEPGSVTLSPGAALAVRARVWGSDETPRILEDHGVRASAVPEGSAGDGARLWRFDLTQLTRETGYRVRVARTESPRYAIRFTGTASPVGFHIRYRAPAYARLPDQEGAAARGDLSALKGSVASIEVTFDRDLDRLDALLPDGRTTRWSPLTPRRWRGEVPVSRAGEYELAATPRAAAGLVSEPTRHRYRVTPLDDAPPVLFVRVPTGDLDLPAGQEVPLDVLAQDDLGLSELQLEVRRDPAAPWSPLSLARFPQGPREAVVTTRWDASGLGLLPGQSASFRFVLWDDDAISGRQSAVSPTFELRFPSLADLYQGIDERQDVAQTSLEKASEQAHELQKSLDKLARQQQAASPQQPSASAFERREEVQRALDRQQEVARRVDDAAQQLSTSLEQAAERHAFDDNLTKKLQELHDLMKQIESPEFRQALERMQKALEQQMQQPATDPALQKMQRNNEELLKNLERSISLLKQLREEEKLQALARRADELKRQQDALNQEHATPKPGDAKSTPSLADRQQQAAERSEQLARDAKAASEDQEAAPAKDAIQQASETLDQQAAPQQHAASQSSEQGSSAQAHQQGQKASESLDQAAQQLQQAVKDMQQSQQEMDLAAVRRAAQDLVSLQRSTESNLSSDAPLDSRGNLQTDLAEGAARVTDSLVALGNKNPALTPQLLDALGQAVRGLRQSGRELGTGNRGKGEQLGRDGAAALNLAVLQLRDTESGMCNKPGGGKPGKSGKPNQQNIGEIGERQSQLNRETQSVARRLTQQMNMSTGDQAEMRRLAEEQARIRQELESVQRDEDRQRQLLGRLDQAQKEMKEVEESLENGQSLDQLEDKQTRILSRLLDAQRSINRRDFEPQRESRPGDDVARSSPAELPADLMKENDRLRLDLLKADTDRYPAQYRALVESYLRTLNGSRR
ncbi:MAG: hypothetical protein ACHQ52_06160 [Candidatus Eisenbacteria bacterium]